MTQKTEAQKADSRARQAARRAVLKGAESKTTGGLEVKDLKRNPKTAHIVSVEASKAAKAKYKQNLLMKEWKKLVMKHFKPGSGAEGYKKALKAASKKWIKGVGPKA